LDPRALLKNGANTGEEAPPPPKWDPRVYEKGEPEEEAPLLNGHKGFIKPGDP